MKPEKLDTVRLSDRVIVTGAKIARERIIELSARIPDGEVMTRDAVANAIGGGMHPVTIGAILKNLPRISLVVKVGRSNMRCLCSAATAKKHGN